MKNKKVDSWDLTSQKYLAVGMSSLSAQSDSTFLGVLREETDDISDRTSVTSISSNAFVASGILK